MTEIQYCTRCLYPSNHPLGLTFDEHGVCSGCRVHEERTSLDWDERFERLRTLTDAYRSRTPHNYDCVVPVSGARDSFFILHTVTRRLGLNPLIVSYNRHHNTRVGIRNLAYLRTEFDCDYIQQTLRPQLVQRVNRETLHRLGSVYWHVLAGQTAFPVQVAVRLRIPLIIWGAHQGCDQVGMFSHTDEVEMSRKYRKEHDLMGLEADDLVGGVEGLSERDLSPYRYPSARDIARVGVRGIYLSNYIAWDTKRQHEEMLDLYGYETKAQQRTFDPYNDADCVHYNGAHDLIKVRKWGYGKAVDHASREIRWGRLSREEGLDLAAAHQDVAPRDLDALLAFNGISKAEFEAAIDARRDPAVWARTGDGSYSLKASVLNDRDNPRATAARLPRREDGAFRPATSSADEEAFAYTLMERGWLDERGHAMAGDHAVRARAS